MVKRTGQAIPEFMMMLAILTLFGILISTYLIGPQYNGGVGHNVQVNAASRVMQDKD